jgi:hypothetical protein
VLSGAPDGLSIFVLTHVFVRSDAAKTAANILGSEGLFRAGYVAEIFGILLFASSMVLLYELFKPASGTLARAMLCAGLIGSGIQVLDTLADIAALMLVKGGGSLAALPVAEAQALASMFLRMHVLVYDLALVFIGTGQILIGALVLRATFLPRILGVMMTIDGLGYITHSLTTFLAPSIAAHLYPYLPFGTAIIGEGPLFLWLIVRGVQVERWEAQAAAAVGWCRS